MNICTPRLTIARFTPDMAQRVHQLSLDSDTRAFIPDEVFETADDAAEALAGLIASYGEEDSPLAYPVLLNDAYIGYVQLVPMGGGSWEIGYHIGSPYSGCGYATEAVRAFLPVIMNRLSLSVVHGVCLAENTASIRVLEKCGFIRTFEGEADYQGQHRHVVRMIFRK